MPAYVQLAWPWAPSPGPRSWQRIEVVSTSLRVTVIEPKPSVPPPPPPTWGDCQRAEAKRVLTVIGRGEAKRPEDVPPEPCPSTRCKHNLRSSFPRAEGELCVLRLSVEKLSTHEIGRRIGMSHTAVVKMEAEALASARTRPGFRAALDELGDDRGEVHSVEARLRRALVKLGPSTWPMIGEELGFDGCERRSGIDSRVRSDGEVYRVREALYRMARQRTVRLTEANGEDWFSVEDGE